MPWASSQLTYWRKSVDGDVSSYCGHVEGGVGRGKPRGRWGMTFPPSADGTETASTVGVATSTILSAKSASLERSVMVSAEARTMWTFTGSRWRKSLFSGVVLKWSPSNHFMWRRSWVGLWSSSSSPLMSCCNFLYSDMAVHFISSALSMS